MDASQQAGPSNLKTPQTDQSEWASISTPTTTISSGTPSRHTLPRRLSLLQNDSTSSSSTSSPIRSSDDARRTSFTGGPKPLSLGSQSVVTGGPSSSGSTATDTPRRGKRTSLSYIPSPSTSVKAAATADDGQLARAPSTSSASGRTRTGSISRATGTTPRRRPSQASQGGNSDADDWLMSEEDASFSLPTRTMAERDSAKVEALFNDTGYREGITAGKLSTLQGGFDQGFNEVGALLGRQVGLLRGQIAALLVLLTSPTITHPTTSTTTSTSVRKVAGRSRASPAAGASGASALPLLANPKLEEAKVELRALARQLDHVTLAQLAEPDYDAMEHEREHQDASEEAVKRETEEEKANREKILSDLKQRLQGNGHASRRTPSLTSLPDPSSSDLLRLIAEKERRCFELREELSTEEASLKQLRITWQRLATQTLAYPNSTPSIHHHRRDTSTTSSISTSEAASEAWSTFSSKLPSGLKMQLNNLLESLANVDNPPPPEPVEKHSPLSVKAPLATTTAMGDAGMLLRPQGGGLGVLEEEGSDVGSVSALSPRSPRSPAPTQLSHPHPPPNSASKPFIHPHQELASLAVTDSAALGFTVDSHGIAHPTKIEADDENPPPTPPKTEPRQTSSTWASRRTSSILGFGALSNKGEEGGFASMLSKKFNQAKENASDLLREAERKLGNAMTIDDLLGVNNNAGSSGDSPRIKLDEASLDSSYNQSAAAETSPWFAAAGGARRSSESRRGGGGGGGGGGRSPNLLATVPRDHDEHAGGRLSVSSSRSSLSLPSLPRAASPHASPPIGGAPGSAGVFGMLMGSQSDLFDESDRRRVSGGSWGWGANNDDDDDWEETNVHQKQKKKIKDRSSMVSIGLNGDADVATPKVHQNLI
ncbi:uncharacterized protein UTRI_04631_B [Ustilago trichophora]|uniref:Protein YAE1 n=1 Tax=Ustilago trichophora TaxID=86804 RepID=A0A5C3EC93_9BASI|nr:uncharacterized protein UTRI_04631_B [Ustilago trichophora]